MSVEENKATIRRIIEEWDKGNFDIVDELVAPDFVYHLPGSDDIRGRGGLKEYGRMTHAAFPDGQHIFEDIFGEGDKVVARFTFRGTQKGGFLGTAPTGKQIQLSSTVIWRFKDGQIVEEWANFNF